MTEPRATLDALLGEPTDRLLAGFARAAGLLDRHGWAEANAGNLSWRIDRQERPLLVTTGSGTRMREVAADPAPRVCVVEPSADWRNGRLLAGPAPTSELPTHLAAARVLAGRRPDLRTLVHAHPPHMIALSMLFPEPESLLGLLVRMHTEMPAHRDRLAALPVIAPGTVALAEATARLFGRHDAVIWARHGMAAAGTDFDSALDLIELTERAAELALLAGEVPRPPRIPGSRARRSAHKGRPAPDGIETFHPVRARDSTLPAEEFARLPRHPVHVVLDNLRSAFNVGSIFRLADAVRAAEVVTCGYTAHPPHAKLEQTALGTTVAVPTRHVESVTDILNEFRSRGIRTVAIETAEGARPLPEWRPELPVALVFGNEALGVSQPALALCDETVELPVLGYKNSVNVAAAAAVVLYDVAAKAGWLDSGPEG